MHIIVLKVDAKAIQKELSDILQDEEYSYHSVAEWSLHFNIVKKDNRPGWHFTASTKVTNATC